MDKDKQKYEGRKFWQRHLLPVIICVVFISIITIVLLGVLHMIPLSTTVISLVFPLIVAILGVLVPFLQTHYGNHASASFEKPEMSTFNKEMPDEPIWFVPYRRNSFFT